MRTKKLALGGAAIIALAAALAFSGASAQTSEQDNGLYGSKVNPPQVSTPAEKQTTKQLNEQNATGTTTPPAVLNGDASSSGTMSTTNYVPPANPPPPPSNPNGPQSSLATAPIQLAQADPQATYQDQQQQYQQQQQDYQQKQQEYDAQKHQYDRDLRRYDQAKWEYTDYPHTYAYQYDDSPRLQRLYLIAEPSQQLSNAPVEGRSGNWVGRVRNVETAPDGRPARVEIALNRRVSVWVNPSHLRFDSADHIVFTDLTRDDLWGMPGATYESSGM